MNLKADSAQLLFSEQLPKKPFAKRRLLITMIVLILLGVAIALILVLAIRKDEEKQIIKCEGGHEQYGLNSSSILGKFNKAAVAVDSIPCPEIGKQILFENGSAIDAAIASGLCNSVHNLQSAGIGGGHFMLIYLRQNKTYFAIDARDRAPNGASQNMFINNPELSLKGGLASGVPGEIAGFWKAHQLGGVLSWKRLFEPTIKLCREGITVSPTLASALKQNIKYIRNDNALKRNFINPITNDVYKVNDTIKLPELAQTLEIISNDGYQAFYNGSLSPKIVRENNLNGGIITLEDLKNYEAISRPVHEVKLTDKYRALVMAPPSSGLLITFILNILKRFNLTEKDIQDTKSEGLFLHRFVEATRFAFAKRSYLGDPDFVNLNETVQNLTNESYIDMIFNKISDSRTFTHEYYGPVWDVKNDHGTAHTSILAPNGDAVAMTNTINNFFGAKYAGEETGIIYNDNMDDFSTPGTVNSFGVPASPANYIAPNKRPMSSMSPLIVLDDNDDVRLVLGASGGTKIISAVSSIAFRNLWLNQNIKDSVDELRIHDQLYPNYALIEEGFSLELEKILLSKGHELRCLTSSGSISQGIERRPDNQIWANSDFRKGGTVAGF